MAQTEVIGGPHVRAPSSVPRTMVLVLLASSPAAGLGLYLFGWPALNLLMVTIAAALLSETLSLWLMGKPVRSSLFDGSALLTAWLLALTLPPWAPWWIGALGGAFAILIGKQVFGGIGQNLFNPAMLARVALLISFPLEMTTWAQPHPLFAADSPDFLTALSITFGTAPHIDGMTSATVLGYVKTGFTQGHTLSQSLTGHFAPTASLLGDTNGSLGETSALLVVLGGLVLLQQRIITWQIPLAMLAAIAALSGLFHWIDPERYGGVLFHLLSGGALLGAFFIATDPVTSPSSPRGQLLFGAGCGALTWVIRTWGGYPEGVAFAVLLMNAVTPLIDHYLRPRVYGRTRRGEPLRPPAPRNETSDE
jgi:electron transport complex protein RnfD